MTEMNWNYAIVKINNKNKEESRGRVVLECGRKETKQGWKCHHAFKSVFGKTWNLFILHKKNDLKDRIQR